MLHNMCLSNNDLPRRLQDRHSQMFMFTKIFTDVYKKSAACWHNICTKLNYTTVKQPTAKTDMQSKYNFGLMNYKTVL